ncbi:MAG: BON domain-containing protein [Methylacidiphilales bacterium]|nr:BON domain-containing protein [Candidatus Methylacidiphilales bacterium]
MSKPSPLRYPSLEFGSGEATAFRPSLYDNKEDFIQRIAPMGMAAIYFGGFTLRTQDAPLSRQALYKLSFLYRHFLQPSGVKIAVQRNMAILSGEVANPTLVTAADILARQIEGIRQVKNETVCPNADASATCSAIQFLFATDQTLRSTVRVDAGEGKFALKGELGSEAQKHWAEQLAEAVSGGKVQSQITVGVSTPHAAEMARPPQIDDESLQTLVLLRLKLVRETEDVSLKVKANRGMVSLHGKVRSEALRQWVENLSRSTLGLRELRSALSIAD